MKNVEKNNNIYIRQAFKEAQKAYDRNETPVGAVIVKKGVVVSKAYNKKNKTNNAINHAEIIAINKAVKKIDNWRLIDCDIYVTLEPCPMCASAIRQSRIKNIYYCTSNSNVNNIKLVEKILSTDSIDPKTNIFKINSCEENILSQFYQKKRK